MPFIVLLIAVTLSIAASAAFFSVYGMSQLFTGALIPVIIMGASLEAGKLMGASFLYRYSKEMGWWLKVYLTLAILVLMVITSMGIFGFLTAAYQQDTIPLVEMQQKIELYDTEYTTLIDRRSQIDDQIAAVGGNYVTAKQRLVKEFQPEREVIESRMAELIPMIQELKTQEVSVKARIGPIMFISEITGSAPNVAVFWFTLILISVFDPLAVALTIAVNIALRVRRESNLKAGKVKEVNLKSLKGYINSAIEKQIKPTQSPTPEPTPEILNEQ